jgi:hypothetical protein
MATTGKTRSEQETTKRKCVHFGFSTRDHNTNLFSGFYPISDHYPKERKESEGRMRERERGREKEKENEEIVQVKDQGDERRRRLSRKRKKEEKNREPGEEKKEKKKRTST